MSEPILADAATVRWEPRRAAVPPPWPQPPMPLALARGARGRCPCCGDTALFAGWLRVTPACAACKAPLGEVCADDAPPYFTIGIVAHLVIPAMLLAEQTYAPGALAMAAVALPATAALSCALLRPVKGACVALALRLGLLREGVLPHGDGLPREGGLPRAGGLLRGEAGHG